MATNVITRRNAPSFLRLPVLCLFFAAMIAEPAWISYKLYEPAVLNSDAADYLSIANGNFDVWGLHRYRLLVPEAVRLLPLPHRAGFFLINTLLVGAAAALLYEFLLTYTSPAPAFLGLISFLMSRDVILETGTPMVDSLLFLAIAAGFYAIRTKSSAVLALVLLLGTAVKENLLFLVPILIWYGPVRKNRAIGLAALGVCLEVAIRHSIDAYIGASMFGSVSIALAHVQNIVPTIRALLTLHGVGTLWMAFGPFWAVVIYGSVTQRECWLTRMDAPLIWWLPLVVVQMLLAGGGNVSRMAVLAFPTMAAAVALIAAYHPFMRRLLWITETPKGEKSGTAVAVKQ
jgi:hypothetical protein